MTTLRLSPRLLRGLSDEDARSVRHAWTVARTHLGTIQRRSGETYAWHGAEVALAVREISSDPVLLRVALLHDSAVHPENKALLRQAGITPMERLLIEGMQRMRRLHIDESTRDLDTVIDAVTEDERLLLLRMAHRLNDVRHLARFTRELRLQIARETLHMYTAIAGRIGFHRWRTEMEDTCFAVVHPRAAATLKHRFRSNAQLDNSCLEHTQRFLRTRMREAGIPAEYTLRIKGLYSSYRKMLSRNRTFMELTDRLAIRIIVNSIDDCYRTLGIVHGSMHPMPGKLKDYIGAPKENGYRSIHTVVYPLPGVTEQPIEIQIRTTDMNNECEEGPVSHTRYKTWRYALTTNTGRVHLLRNLESLRAESRSTKEFEQALRSYFRDDHVTIFDPRGRLAHLHKQATALDYVCAAFPDRIAHLREVRINGRLQRLDTPLHDGDTVDPRFAKTVQCTHAWLSLCKLPHSRRVLDRCLRTA